MAAGRTTTLPDRALIQLRQALDGTRIEPRALLDAAVLEAAVVAELAGLERAPVDATIAMGADGPVTTPARAGATVDAAPVARAAVEALGPVEAPAELVLEVTPTAVPPGIDDATVAIARSGTGGAGSTPPPVGEISVRTSPSSLARSRSIARTAPGRSARTLRRALRGR